MNTLTILFLLIALAALSLPTTATTAKRIESSYNQRVGAAQNEQAQ